MDSGQMGFIVDEVDAVINISDQAISTPPKIGEDGLKEKIILCLNAAKILREDEY